MSRHPEVMRVQTERGEATLIVANGIVEHTSPCLPWALSLPLPTLLRWLRELEWPAVWVRPRRSWMVNGRRRSRPQSGRAGKGPRSIEEQVET